MKVSNINNQGRKNKLGLKVLEIIGDISLSTIDLLDRLTAGGKYLSKEDYKNLIKRRDNRHLEWDKELVQTREKQNFYNLLYRLQKSGLIEKKKNKGQTFWFITNKGKKRKDELFFKLRTVIFAPKEKYLLEPSEYPIIVVFDIPEKEKNKRNWLRAVLRYLEFELLQKSVWIGNNKLPQELLSDLGGLGILSSVKIFSVLEKGNI